MPAVSRTTTDSLTASLTATRQQAQPRVVTDFIFVLDSPETTEHFRTASESLVTLEVARTNKPALLVTEAPRAADAVTRAGVFVRSTTESLNAAGVAIRGSVRYAVDHVTASGVATQLARASVRSATESLSASDVAVARPTPYLPGPVIYVDGVNITKAVGDPILYATARFMSAVNGVAGEASFRARDDEGNITYTPGQSLELIIDGQRVWTGFVTNVKRVYAFPALNVTEFGPTRFFDIEGADLNILFSKRIVFNQSTPANVLAPLYGPHTPDVNVISELFANWLDLSGDGLDTSSGVVAVGDINEDQNARPWEGSDTWGQAMESIASLPAAIYYIRPDWQFAYVDTDTPDAPFALTDVLAGSGGGSETTLTDPFARTVAQGWGTGPLGPWTDDSGAFPFVSHVTPGTAFGGDNAGVKQAFSLTPGGTFAELRVKFKWHSGPSSGPEIFFRNDLTGSPLVEIILDRDSGSIIVAEDGPGFGVGTCDVFNPGDVVWAVLRIDADSTVSGKVWLASGSEPGFQATFVAPTTIADFTYGIIQTFDSPTPGWEFYEVSYTTGTPAPPPTDFHGYREMEILLDGTNLANDVLAWGIGYGSNVPVFTRAEDTDSQTDHGLWQLGQTTFGVYKQATIDRIADSILNGSPEHHRGAKDDRPAVTIVTYETGLLPAQKVDFTSEVFGYNDVLPIRKMEVTFPAPDKPRYELTLSHEIDTPWSFFDPFRYGLPQLPDFNPQLPGVVYPPGYPPPPTVPPTPGDCTDFTYNLTDDYNRTVGSSASPSWGNASSGFGWTNALDSSGGAQPYALVNGTQGVIATDASPFTGNIQGETATLNSVVGPADVYVTVTAGFDLANWAPTTPGTSDFVTESFTLQVTGTGPALYRATLDLSKSLFTGTASGNRYFANLTCSWANGGFIAKAITTVFSPSPQIGPYTIHLHIDGDATFAEVSGIGTTDPLSGGPSIPSPDTLTGVKLYTLGDLIVSGGPYTGQAIGSPIGYYESKFDNFRLTAPCVPSGPLIGAYTEQAARIDDTHFQLSRSIDLGTLQLYIGMPGLILQQDVDYTVDGPSGVVTMTNPVPAGTAINANYQAAGPTIPTAPVPTPGGGATIYVGRGQIGMEITANDTVIDGYTFVGPGCDIFGNAFAIYGVGAYTGVIIRNCVFIGFDHTAIWLEGMVGPQTYNNQVFDTTYIGIGYIGCNGGSILNNVIQRVGKIGHQSPDFNAYAIAVTMEAGGPPSTDVLVQGNLCTDVPLWHGLDTHGGVRVSFINNTVLRCARAIFITANQATERATSVLVQANLCSQPQTAPGGTDMNTGITTFDTRISSVIGNAVGSAYPNITYDSGGLSVGLVTSPPPNYRGETLPAYP